MSTLHDQFDRLTPERLNGVLGIKWTAFPECIGAFIAEMDFGTAPAVTDALRKTVDAGYFGYLPACLEAELQKAVCAWYARHTDWEVAPEMTRSMPDVLACLQVLLAHYAPKGGKVIVPTPAYAPFLNIPGHYGREVLQVPMIEQEDGWAFDFDGIDRSFADGGEVLIVCNPMNPLGRVLRRDEMERLASIVDAHGGRVFSDEIHAPLIYPGQQHIPYASVSVAAANHAVTAIAASKAWNLAGLKCAQIVFSNERDRDYYRQTPAANFTSHGTSTLGAVASVAAYTNGEPWLQDVITYLDGNRHLLAELVAEHLPGVRYHIPEGTYLAWLDMTATEVPEEAAAFFREHAHVAMVDGSVCGNVGMRCLRFNFSMSRPMLEETITAMGSALAVPA